MRAMDAKLTIIVPKDLRRRAKARAAIEGKTISEIIRAKLEEYASGLDAMEEADDLRAIQEIENRIAKGKEKVGDWAEFEARLDGL